jgi:hypothetical protein
MMGIDRVRPWSVVVAVAMLWVGGANELRGDEAFTGRLSTVPVDPVTALTTTGSGTLTAVLAGNTLTINGKFDGLNSPATVAHVHRARRGLRGPNLFNLTVTKATSGTVEGTLKLTDAQVEALKSGWYYVQIHTEINPEGQLRGWLLK